MMGNRHIRAIFAARLPLLFILSLGYSLLLPPFEGPDEPAHFLRAYGIAEGEWVLRDHPAEVVSLIMHSFERFRGQESAHMLSLMDSDLEKYGEHIPNLAYNSSLYSPVPYLPYALVIKIIGLLGKSDGVLYASLYLCRIVSILVFLALYALALSLAPKMNLPFFWIMATPMALAQIGMLSTDYVLYGTSLVLLAGEPSLGRNPLQAVGYIASVFILFVTKITYLPLAMIPLVHTGMQVRTRRSDKAMWIVVIGILVGILGAASWNIYAAHIGIFKRSLEIAERILGVHLTIDPVVQFHFILHHPLDFLGVILHSLATHGGLLFHQFVGILGWLDLPIPTAALWLWLIGAFIVSFISDVADDPSWRSKLFMGTVWIAGAVATFIALCASAYIVWMPIGSALINLQGRYLHPIVAAFLVGIALLRPFEVKDSLARRAGRILPFLAIMINLLAIYNVVARYGLWWLGK